MVALLLLIPVVFGILFIVFIALSPNKKQTRVTKIDPTTQQEIVEVHETEGSTTARTAARATLGCLAVVVGALALGLLILLSNAR